MSKLDNMAPLIHERELLGGHGKLSPSNWLVNSYAQPINRVEKILITNEMRGRDIALIIDGTPRLGDTFGIIARFTVISELYGPIVVQRLLRVVAYKSTITGPQILAALGETMLYYQVEDDHVRVVTSDGVSANLSSSLLMDLRREEGRSKMHALLIICFSHCGSNSGKELKKANSFPLLQSFWALLQACFKNSSIAKEIWLEKTGKKWLGFNEIRWYIEHNIFSECFLYFNQLIEVVTALENAGHCDKSAGKLVDMFNNELTSRLLQMELAAYVEGLLPLQQFTLKTQADYSLSFTTAGLVEEVIASLDAMKLPSFETLLVEYTLWVNDPLRSFNASLAEAKELLAVARAELDALKSPVVAPNPSGRVRRANAGQGAALAVESAFAKRARERGAAEDAARLEEKEVASLNHMAAVAAAAPTKDPNAIRESMREHLKPAVKYFKERFSPGGDRYDLFSLFKGASVFVPKVGKTLTEETGGTLLDKLSVYPAITLVTIAGLKKELPSYIADSKGSLISSENLAPWHYSNRSKRPVFYQTFLLLMLVQPSSAAIERVFSLLKSSFSHLQMHTFMDLVEASLLLQYNKRILGRKYGQEMAELLRKGPAKEKTEKEKAAEEELEWAVGSD